MPFSGWEDIHPVLRERAQRLFEATGAGPGSGFRTRAEQQFLYDCFHNCRPECHENCHPANPPGTSWHEHGLAIDADPGPGGYGALKSRAAEFGLHFPIPGEEWHFQPVECRGPRYDGDPFPAQTESPEQKEDSMGVYGGFVPAGENRCFGLVPPGEGASGGGYAKDVWISAAVDNFGKPRAKCRWALIAADGKVIDAKDDLELATGRTLLAVAHKGATAISINNKATDKVQGIGVMIEWARP